MPKKPRPPKHLSKPMVQWWRHVTDEYELDEHHLKLLQAACEAWDRMCQARDLLNLEGLTVRDGNGNQKPHPAFPMERDSRLAFARLVRELDLDVDSAPTGTRPPALRSNRRGVA